MGLKQNCGIGVLFEIEVFQLRFNLVERSWHAAPRRRIDQDNQLIIVEERIAEVKAADAEVNDTDVGCEIAFRQTSRNLTAKPVIAQKDIPNTGDKNPASIHGTAFHPLHSHALQPDRGSTSSGAKKNRCAGCRKTPKSRPGSSSITTAI